VPNFDDSGFLQLSRVSVDSNDAVRLQLLSKPEAGAPVQAEYVLLEGQLPASVLSFGSLAGDVAKN
jgi:hypothetical protein